MNFVNVHVLFVKNLYTNTNVINTLLLWKLVMYTILLAIRRFWVLISTFKKTK